jgi:hypothetical protein
MRVHEPCGAPLCDCFHLKPPVLAITRALRESRSAVVDVTSDKHDRGVASPIPSESAFILSLQPKDLMAHELRLGGRSVRVVPFPQGMMSLLNLALDPTPYSDGTFDCCSVYFRRDTFAAQPASLA